MSRNETDCSAKVLVVALMALAGLSVGNLAVKLFVSISISNNHLSSFYVFQLVLWYF